MKTYDQEFTDALQSVRNEKPITFVYANRASNFLGAFLAGSGMGGIAGIFAATPSIVGFYKDEIIIIGLHRHLASVSVNDQNIIRIQKSAITRVKKLNFPVQLFVTLQTKEGKTVLEINKIWLALNAQRKNWKVVRDLMMEWQR